MKNGPLQVSQAASNCNTKLKKDGKPFRWRTQKNGPDVKVYLVAVS